MGLVYFDSSAFVKLVVEELGTDLASELWDGCDAALSSRLGGRSVEGTPFISRAPWPLVPRTSSLPCGIDDSMPGSWQNALLLPRPRSMPDPALAECVHAIVTSIAPELSPKTWYVMPAYANEDGKVVVSPRW